MDKRSNASFRIYKVLTLLILSLILGCSDLPSGASETDYDVTFVVNESEVIITGLSEHAKSKSFIEIPSQILGKPVTEISQSAFSNSNLANISIPDSVEFIWSEAFYLTRSLSKVVLGSGLIALGKGVFAQTSLSEVTVKSFEPPITNDFRGSFPSPLEDLTLYYPFWSDGYSSSPWGDFGTKVPVIPSHFTVEVKEEERSLSLDFLDMPTDAKVIVSLHYKADFSDVGREVPFDLRPGNNHVVIPEGHPLSLGAYYIQFKGISSQGESTPWQEIPGNPYIPHLVTDLYLSDVIPQSQQLSVDFYALEGRAGWVELSRQEGFNNIIESASFVGTGELQRIELSQLNNDTAYFLRIRYDDSSTITTYTTKLIPAPQGKQYIHRLSELAKIGVDEENYPANGEYILMSDLDFKDANNDGLGVDPFDSDEDAGNGNWTPLCIGNFDMNNDYVDGGFTGNFDGGSYSITGMEIKDTNASSVGFFSVVDDVGVLASDKNGGEVYDLGLLDSQVQVRSQVGNLYSGILIGFLGSRAEVDSCYTSGEIAGEADSLGGLIGMMHYGKIRSSYSTANVTGSSNVGGLVGVNNNGTITRAYTIGDVSGLDNVGGVVGKSLTANLNYTYAVGDVRAGGSFAGGLVGYLSGQTLVSGGLVAGDVSGYHHVYPTADDAQSTYAYYGQTVTVRGVSGDSGTPLASLENLRTPVWYVNVLQWTKSRWEIEGLVDQPPYYYPHLKDLPDQPFIPLPSPPPDPSTPIP